MNKFEVANGIQFSDADVVDLDAFIAEGEYNPHNIHPWVLHDHGFVICVVFAGNLQDALDSAVDENKMDQFLIKEDDLKNYPDDEGITYLGNASEPFDIEGIGFIELVNPPRSFVALMAATKAKL